MSYNYPTEITNDFLFHFPLNKRKDKQNLQNFDLNKTEKNDSQSVENQNNSKKTNRLDICFSKLQKNTAEMNNFHFTK
jgi:hypothetical protein